MIDRVTVTGPAGEELARITYSERSGWTWTCVDSECVRRPVGGIGHLSASDALGEFEHHVERRHAES